MKALQEIFSDFEQPADHAGGLLAFLTERFPEKRFHLVYGNGRSVSSDGVPLVPEDEGARLLSLRGDPNRSRAIPGPDGTWIHILWVDALNAVLTAAAADSEDGAAWPTAVRLCVELFLSQKALGEKEELLSTQKRQLTRKLMVLEKKYQEILEENHRGHEIIQKQQEDYSQRLQSEIDRQTAKLLDANRNLETKRRLQQKILDTAATAIYTTDTERRITGVNTEFCAMTGYAENEVSGQSTDILEGDPADACHPPSRTAGGVDKHQCSLRAKDGRKLQIIKRADNLIDDTGAVIGTVESFVDVTDLIEAREKAVAASKAKSVFLASMSHEIRTPLNAVIGFTDMLLDSALNDDQIDFAKTIKRSGEVLLGLIDDILDFSKVEAGQMDLECIDFDPEVTAFDVCELVRTRVAKKPIEILYRIADRVPAYVKGDPGRFRQVMLNLMGNAVKFTEAGEIELFLDMTSEKADRIKIHVQVRDTGIGIPEEKLDAIFEAFQQADDSTTRKYGGTGLGLSICRKIAGLMDGKVWVESPAVTNRQKAIARRCACSPDNGPGSIFHFTCWMQRSDPRAEDKIGRASLSGRKVLVVDDNPANLDILQHMLETVDMQVECLQDGAAVVPALQAADTAGDPFDIAVVDILLGNMTGFDVAQHVRRQAPGIAGTPLLAFSSSLDKNAEKCRQCGFNGFLPKPIRRKKFYQMLERLLGHSEKGSAAYPGGTSGKIHTQHSIREEMKHSVCILLAEDNAMNQKLAVLLLTNAGYKVEVADNGTEALEKYMRAPDRYDLIFMDIQMPGMDGMACTQAIREVEKNRVAGAGAHHRIPIVAMTANVMKGDREIYLEAGMDDYVPKPINRKIVFEMVEKWILRDDSHPRIDSR